MILRLIADGKPVFLRITSAISPRTPPAKTQLEMMDAIDLMTGDSCCIVADTVLKNELRAAYPNDGYVNKEFQVKKFSPRGGKRYATFEITEIRIADPTDSAQGVITVTQGGAGSLKESSFLQSYANYNDYLKSSLWGKIKRRVLKRDGNLCLRCGGKATTVHHRSYADAVMAGNDDDKLASICDGCHNFISLDDACTKRSADETERLLLLRDESTDYPTPKVDLRLKQRKDPPGWHRMSAVQRSAFHREHERLKLLHWLRVGRSPQTVRRMLQSFYGMDDQAIDAELSELWKRKTKKRTQPRSPDNINWRDAEEARLRD